MIDAIPRVETPPFDYAPLADMGEDLIHLDWDMAVSPEDLDTFAHLAMAAPQDVLVAPYRTYPGSIFGADPQGRDLESPVWTAKVYSDAREQSMRNVTEDDTHAHLWGFGLVYLPAKWLCGYAARFPGEKMGDGEFSGWYYRQAGPALLAWGVRPVHLNFPPPWGWI